MAPSISKNIKRGSSVKMDMLTNLPKEIKEQILMYLPIKEAGRTSILSSQWRFTWTSIPELKFIDEEIISDRSNSEGVVVKVIDAVFARHNGPIRKFSLFTEEYLMNNEMDGWIESLSKNGIREITLYLPDEDIEIFPEVPSSFFSCHELNYVNLRCCNLKLPSWFKGFKFLHTLVLEEITVSAGDFEKLVSSSNLLEKLILGDVEGVIKINSTNLKYLRVEALDSLWENSLDLQVYAQRLETTELDGSFKSIQVNAPKLSYLCIHSTNEEENISIRYIGDLPDLKKLHIKYLQSFPIEPWMEELYLLNRVKYLSLDLYHGMPCNHHHVEFLEKVIYLEVLDINMHCWTHISPWEVDAKEDLFKHLRTVNICIVDYRALNSLLLFVKFILGSAPQLQALTIKEDWKCCEKNDVVERMMLKQLLMFPRASPKAVIIY